MVLLLSRQTGFRYNQGFWIRPLEQIVVCGLSDARRYPRPLCTYWHPMNNDMFDLSNERNTFLPD